jgi:lysophospholipase L1-like esterase
MTSWQIIILVLIAIPILLVLLLVAEGLIAMSGEKTVFINPDPTPILIGKGVQKLNYLVMGDSASAGQGADYEKGIAMQTSLNLASKYSVSLTNLSQSGATTQDLISKQLNQATKLKPDLVLISISANDLTHFTSTKTLKKNLQIIIEQLIKSRCDVKIVLTGTPDMGSVARFLQPLRWLAGYQTKVQNQIFDQVIQEYNLTLAPIAKDTGTAFRADHSLFAEDKFHPNEKGYALWSAVINQAIEKSLASEPSHCK